MRVAASYALSQVSNGDANIDAALRFALDDPARDARAYASRALVQKGDVKQALSVFVNSMDEYDYSRTNWGPTESLKTLIAVSPPDVASILNSGKLSNSELVDLIKSIDECAKGDQFKLKRLRKSSISLEQARWTMAKIWFGGAGILILLLIAQSFGTVYQGYIAEVWNWALPTVMPTLSLIIAVLKIGKYNKARTI